MKEGEAVFSAGDRYGNVVIMVEHVVLDRRSPEPIFNGASKTA
jgi:hypothetical protein